MSLELILFILVQLIALVYFVETLRRVNKRVMEYNLKESRETLPFGFVKIRHVVIFYILSYILWIVFSILIYLYFVTGNSLLFIEGNRSGGSQLFELNL